MKRTMIWLTGFALVGMFWLGVPQHAEAAPYIGRAGHMPGWDWWRTYPWSPYNYGRNPYNPIIVPSYYPYPMTYPPYVPQPEPTPAVLPAAPALPTVTGPLSSPPPGTAIIRVRVPAVWAKVKFDGTDSVTSGTQRWFVTPRLGDGGASYKVTASWTSDGRPVQATRQVRVQAGQISAVDFTGAGTQ
jgi:uncharacterized protein (TIGR03000 family)